MQVNPLSEPIALHTKITLKIQALGHVPSFKNSKMILPAKGNRRAMLITDPKKQRWMKQAVDLLTSQLISSCQTSSQGTLMEERLQSLIACLPSDDNWKVISHLSAKATKVPKGQEGAVIEVTRIEPLKPQSGIPAKY